MSNKRNRKHRLIYEDILYVYIKSFQTDLKNPYYKDFLHRTGNVISHFFKYHVLLFSSFFAKNEVPEIKDKIWLYIFSQNNYNALKFLKDGLRNTVFISIEYPYRNEGVFFIPYYKKFIYFYKFPWVFFFFLRKDRRFAWRHFDLIFHSIGIYECSLKLLKKHRPPAIIFANDVNTNSRSLLWAAKELNIPTVYIQHACVSMKFPPVKFDLSLFEGQDTLEKYLKIGAIEGSYKLIGMPKIDPYIKLKNSNLQVRNIGICANRLDKESDVIFLFGKLRSIFPEICFSFRPHPALRKKYVLDDRIIISDSRAENSFEFLIKNDLIIAGDSSIHLEAVMLNVVSVYYRFNDNLSTYDSYEFVKNNLIQEAANIEALVFIIKKNIAEKENVCKRAKYYNDTIDSPFEGQSARLAIDTIQQFLS